MRFLPLLFLLGCHGCGAASRPLDAAANSGPTCAAACGHLPAACSSACVAACVAQEASGYERADRQCLADAGTCDAAGACPVIAIADGAPAVDKRGFR